MPIRHEPATATDDGTIIVECDRGDRRLVRYADCLQLAAVLEDARKQGWAIETEGAEARVLCPAHEETYQDELADLVSPAFSDE